MTKVLLRKKNLTMREKFKIINTNLLLTFKH